MATIRRKKPESFAILSSPGPWPQVLINWLATLAVIIVFGLIMLFSASYTTGYLRMGDSFYYIKSQMLCLGLGLAVMLLFSRIDHRFLRRMVWPGYAVCIVMLIAVLFSAPLNGCRRWLRIGFTIQVSEIAKFEMILLTAHLAAKAPHLEKLDPASGRRVPAGQWLYQRIVRELIVPLLPLIPVVFLLMLEPHMSGIVLTTAICGTILLLGGSGGIITWAGGASAVLLLRTVLEHIDSIPYLQSRLDGWTHDLSKMTDQTLQSLYAIGSGGVTGLGLGNGIEKQLWLPEHQRLHLQRRVRGAGLRGCRHRHPALRALPRAGAVAGLPRREPLLHTGGHRHHGPNCVAGVLQHRGRHQHPAQHRHLAALLLLRRHQPHPAAGRDGRDDKHRPGRRARPPRAGESPRPAGTAGKRKVRQHHPARPQHGILSTSR